MSWPRAGSPFHSRSSYQHGRRGDGFFGDQYHSDPWRNPENVDKLKDSTHWRSSHSQTPLKEQVDHWAKFIEAIGRAGKRKSSPDSRYHPQEPEQGFEGKATSSPRRLHKERLTSPQTLLYGAESQRFQSPGRRRIEHHSRGPRSQEMRDNRLELGCHYEEHEERSDERNTYTERSQKSDYRDHHLQPKRFRHLDPQEQYSESRRGFNPYDAPVVVEHGHGIPKHIDSSRDPSKRQDLVQNREHGRNRGPSLSRDPDVSRGPSLSRDPDVSRGPSLSRDPDVSRGPSLSHDQVMNRGPSRSHLSGMNRGHPRSQESGMNQEHLRIQAPGVSQEHQRSRSLLRSGDVIRNHEHPVNRNFHRRNDLPRNYPKGNKPQMDRPLSRNREQRHAEETDNAEMLHKGHGSPTRCYLEEEAAFHNSTAKRGGPVCAMSQHREHPRMGSHPRRPHVQVVLEPNSNVDFRKGDMGTRACERDWDMEIQHGRNRGLMREQGKAFRRNDHHGNPKDRADFMEIETLKIKVDMSHPVGQSSHLGYSSERQLSLDLVNVGRQRLDFLPMLEHSGTYKETALHSGTFAQEIITLVHHVKENYFQSQGITLNARFSNGQSSSVVNEDEYEEESQELEDTGPVINRPFGSTSNTQIVCKVGPLQRKPQAPAPGDLRFDLERKRLQKLEAVKITISGNTQMLQAQDSQAYVSEDDSFEAGGKSGWSELVPQSTNKWDHPPSPKRPNVSLNARHDMNRFGRRPGPRRSRNPNNKESPSQYSPQHYFPSIRTSCSRRAS